MTYHLTAKDTEEPVHLEKRGIIKQSALYINKRNKTAQPKLQFKINLKILPEFWTAETLHHC